VSLFLIFFIFIFINRTLHISNRRASPMGEDEDEDEDAEKEEEASRLAP
jgi:hypothetical protein